MKTIEIPILQIKGLLEMIAMCNKEIKMALAYGKSEESLMVRQSKYMRDKHLQELYALLLEYDIDLKDLVV